MEEDLRHEPAVPLWLTADLCTGERPLTAGHVRVRDLEPEAAVLLELGERGALVALPAGNLNAVRGFDMPNDLRHEIIAARLWAGLHYHFSGVAGVVLGRKVAKFDLNHAFRRVG